jgi:hypothetical protein
MANTTVQLNTEHTFGGVMSIYDFCRLTPIGSLFAGSMAHWITAPLTFALGGLICGCIVLIAILKRRMTEQGEA